MSLQPHELHNQAKDEIIEILKTYYQTNGNMIEDLLVLLETTICSSLLLLTTNPQSQLKIMNLVAEGVKIRLEEINKKNPRH